MKLEARRVERCWRDSLDGRGWVMFYGFLVVGAICVLVGGYLLEAPWVLIVSGLFLLGASMAMRRPRQRRE
jgi:hypothetical protein